jgi:hypothetical protein
VPAGPDDLIVPASRARLVVLVCLAAGFVLLGGWMLTRAADGSFVVAVGGVSVVFFGACGAYALRRLLRPAPALVVTREGILDNASALSVGFIAWDEIAELVEHRVQNQVFLAIVPKDADAVLARLPAWKRRAIRASGLLGAPAITIPQVILPTTVADLLREIRLRYGRAPRARSAPP